MSSITLFFLFIPLLALILLAINLIFAPHNPYAEKNSPFECGFSSFLGQNRTQFSISFFIFALLFLLFDLEILLVYPYIVSGYNNSIYGLVNMLIFFLILTLGFAFELGKKALSIDSRQISDVANKETSIVSQIKDSNKENFNKVSYIKNSIRHMSSIINKDPVYIEINDCSIFFTLADVNFETKIKSSIASLWITKQGFTIDVNRLSNELGRLNIKNFRNIIYLVKNDEENVDYTYDHKVGNIHYIELNLSCFKQAMGKDHVNVYLHETLFISYDTAWCKIVECLKNSDNAISVSGGSKNKRHIISKLDSRLVSYMLIICKFDAQLFHSLNAFDIVNKGLILPFVDYSNKKEVRVTYDSFSPVEKFPIKQDKSNQT